MKPVSPGLALLCCLLANVFCGSTYVLMDLAARGLPDLVITWLRVAISVVLFALVAAARGQLLRRFTAREHALLCVVGIPGYALPCLLGLIGVQWSSPGLGALLVLVEPLAIVPLSMLFLGERPSPGRIGAVLLGALGTGLIITEGQAMADLLVDTTLAGKLVLAVQGALWALFSVAAKPLLRRHSSWTVSTWSLGYAVLPLSLFVILELPSLRPEALDGLASAWGLRDLEGGEKLLPALWATVYLAVIASFLGTLMWNLGLSGVPASTMAAFLFVQPVVGVALDGMLSARWPSTFAMLGTLVILVAVLWSSRAPRGSPAAPAASPWQEHSRAPPGPGHGKRQASEQRTSQRQPRPASPTGFDCPGPDSEDSP